MDRLRNNTKYVIHKIIRTVGFLSLFFGVLGLIFPVIPGIPLLVIGIFILGEESIVSGWIIKKLPRPLREKVQTLLAKRKKE